MQVLIKRGEFVKHSSPHNEYLKETRYNGMQYNKKERLHVLTGKETNFFMGHP